MVAGLEFFSDGCVDSIGRNAEVVVIVVEAFRHYLNAMFLQRRSSPRPHIDVVQP